MKLPVLGRMVGLEYGGGMGSMLSVFPILSELRLNIVPIRLRETVARRATRVLQVKAVFDFSGAVLFTHL